jgi:hypothetical protein
MSTEQLGLDLVRERRDTGIDRATARAERTHRGWNDAAYYFLLSWEPPATNEGRFQAEDVVAAWRGDPPPDGRAWGGVFQRAARAGMISKVGYAPARTSNLSPKTVWQKVTGKPSAGSGTLPA